MNAAPPPTDPTSPPENDRRDPPPGTLGSLLYADRTKRIVPEAEWLALVRSIAAGDARALQALYERSHRIVFTLILRITQSREVAEELTVDVFHDVWRRAGQYEDRGGSVLGWILNQARSRAIDRLRFENRKKRVPPLPERPSPHEDGPTPDAQAHAEQVVELKQQGRRLRDALTLLTREERAAIETAFFVELSYAEVAARLNAPLGTIKTRIRSALGKLREALAPDGVSS